jgi:hypothetical protein
MTDLREVNRYLAQAERDAVRRAFGWCIAAPALAVWPFLSAFPLFEMLSSQPSVTLLVTRSLLLASGFWAVLALFLAYLAAHAGGAAAALAARRRDGGLALGLYAAAWLAAYLVVFVLA